MEIRFLNGGDAGEYWRLRLEALQGDPEAFSSSAEEHQSLSLDEVGRRLGSDGADSFVVGAFDGRSSWNVDLEPRVWIRYCCRSQRRRRRRTSIALWDLSRLVVSPGR